MVTHAREFRNGDRKFTLRGRSLNGYELNRLWRNDGDWRFADISVAAGAADIHDARGFTACDFDADGDLDLYVRNYRGPTVYLRNDGVLGHWLTVRARGTTSNRDGIGAKITVEAGGRRQVRWVTAGSGYLSQMPNQVYFGLGGAARVDRIRVRWPDGSEQEFAGTEANRHLEIVQGSPEPLARPPRPQPVLPGVDDGAPDPLLAALAACDLRELSGAPASPSALAGDRLLVFWAPWCNTCRSEFPSLDRLHAAHAAAGAGVVGIAVLDAHGPTAAETVAELKPGFPVLTLPRADYDRLFGADAAVPRTLAVSGRRLDAHIPGKIRPYLVRSYLLDALRGK